MSTSIRTILERRYRLDDAATNYLRSLNYDLPLAADMPQNYSPGNRRQLYLALSRGGDIYAIPHPGGWPWPDCPGPAHWPWRETHAGKRTLIRPPHRGETAETQDGSVDKTPAQGRFSIV